MALLLLRNCRCVQAGRQAGRQGAARCRQGPSLLEHAAIAVAGLCEQTGGTAECP
jgi:hypothetical protein